ncbi:hypothetical protein NUU61_002857 [Penicillium alfredii]|uniref:Cysteine-rich transmembrane CYSTM domain-containing protein n=1 Tax=Penicillium alfredii TaxID=1506179 RepID=A0A9W9KGE7_9EURO|nr:uncharacterized protein NUU61_002857 [Penicillium alfredii]KAJ5105510.1 hypothetical protein NUU61_002857 [Penicillium alfredii]
MFNFNFFKSPVPEAHSESNWNPDTLTMQQPSSPAAPSSNQNVVTDQPTSQEQMQLRGGGNGGGICCGICAGIACFECCEICC